MAARTKDLLPVEYFHVVFTLPAEIAQIVFWNKKAVYDLLFRASAETVMTIAADPKRIGARVGMTAVLHTWGAALTHHPHIHMIVPGGGLSPDGSRWVACRPGFFLHVRVMSRLFRRLFVDGLLALHRSNALAFFDGLSGLGDAGAFSTWLAPFRKAEWVVYAKPPFGGPEAVLAYLSRYTHRVAISNNRLISADAETVAFCWKDYRIKTGDRQKFMRLATDEFIRRFLIHVLPDGFHPIRHYGLLASAGRKANIAKIRNLLREALPVATLETSAEPSRIHGSPHLSTRQYARIVRGWVASLGLEASAYGTHSMRRTKVAQIYKKTGNLRAVQLLLGHTKMESTVRYLGVDIEDALTLSEGIDL
jgi:hypothetical protein